MDNKRLAGSLAYPEFGEGVEGPGGEAGDEVIEQGERGEGVVDACEILRYQTLQQVPLHVERRQGMEVS